MCFVNADEKLNKLNKLESRQYGKIKYFGR